MKEYKTSDIYIAAALLTVDYELIDMREDEKRKERQYFVFLDHDSHINDVVDQFWRHLPVDALTYSQNLQVLKKRTRLAR